MIDYKIIRFVITMPTLNNPMSILYLLTNLIHVGSTQIYPNLSCVTGNTRYMKNRTLAGWLFFL